MFILIVFHLSNEYKLFFNYHRYGKISFWGTASFCEGFVLLFSQHVAINPLLNLHYISNNINLDVFELLEI